MSEDEFTKLFKYVKKRFDDMDVKFDKALLHRADTRAAIGELSAQVRDHNSEMTFSSNLTKRL